MHSEEWTKTWHQKSETVLWCNHLLNIFIFKKAGPETGQRRIKCFYRNRTHSDFAIWRIAGIKYKISILPPSSKNILKIKNYISIIWNLSCKHKQKRLSEPTLSSGSSRSIETSGLASFGFSSISSPIKRLNDNQNVYIALPPFNEWQWTHQNSQQHTSLYIPI